MKCHNHNLHPVSYTHLDVYKRQMQDEYNCIYALADLHTITVRQEPAQMRKKILDAYASILACGIDTEKSLFFIQSHVHTHAEMAWVLDCYTPVSYTHQMCIRDSNLPCRK